MSDVRFNIETVREINQFKIFSNNGKTTKKIFWAYLPSGFSVNTSMSTDSWFGGIFDSIQRGLSGIIHVGNVLGSKFTGVDIKKYMFYSGTEPIKFSVNTFLILKEDYDKDILEPLQNLMNFYLPKRGTEELESIDSILTESLNKVQSTWSNNQTAGGQFVSKIFNLLNQGYEAVKEFIGPVYTVRVPDQMSNAGETKQQVNNTIFFGRHYYFEDCFITGVNLNFPVFLVEGGRPDVIEVTLNIETARMATADMFKFGKSKSITDEAAEWQWI